MKLRGVGPADPVTGYATKMEIIDETDWPVYPLPSTDGNPLVPVDEDVLLDCGKWIVGRLVQYGRYVAPNVGVVNPVAWCRLPKRGG